MTRLAALFDNFLRRARLKQPTTLFDPQFYLGNYPDVASAGADPYRHYLRHGVEENRMPNPLFDTKFYLSQIRGRPRDPTLHYLSFGVDAGLDPHPRFETLWYLEAHEDVARARLNPLQHYLRHGAAEGRKTEPVYRQTFASLPGYSRDPADLGFREVGFDSGGGVATGESREEHAILLRATEPQQRAVLAALQSVGRLRSVPAKVLLTKAPHSTQPTVGLIFRGCFVVKDASSITIHYAEARLFFLSTEAVRFICAFNGGRFTGVYGAGHRR